MVKIRLIRHWQSEVFWIWPKNLKFEEAPVLQFCHGDLSLPAKELQVVCWIRPVKARDRKEQGSEIDIGGS